MLALLILALIVSSTGTCFSGPLTVQVVFNHPAVHYNEAKLTALNATAVGEGMYAYRSPFDNRVSVCVGTLSIGGKKYFSIALKVGGRVQEIWKSRIYGEYSYAEMEGWTHFGGHGISVYFRVMDGARVFVTVESVGAKGLAEITVYGRLGEDVKREVSQLLSKIGFAGDVSYEHVLLASPDMGIEEVRTVFIAEVLRLAKMGILDVPDQVLREAARHLCFGCCGPSAVMYVNGSWTAAKAALPTPEVVFREEVAAGHTGAPGAGSWALGGGGVGTEALHVIVATLVALAVSAAIWLFVRDRF